MSSYDSFNNPNLNKHNLPQRLGPNAHDDLKSSIPKTDTPEQSPSRGPPRWEPPPNHRHEHRHPQGAEHPPDFSPRNSQEMDRPDMMLLDPGRNHDKYHYLRSPTKATPPKHLETKTDYGKYRYDQCNVSNSSDN